MIITIIIIAGFWIIWKCSVRALWSKVERARNDSEKEANGKLELEKKFVNSTANWFVPRHLHALPSSHAKVAYNEPRFKYALQSSTMETSGRVFKETF